MKNSKINVLFSRPKEKLVEAFSVLPSNRFMIRPFPTITIEAVEQSDNIYDPLMDIKSFDFAVFTSHYAVLHTMNHIKNLGIPLKSLHKLIICAVGPMVSQQLNKYDLNTHMIPHVFTAKSLCDLFPPITKNSKKVLFPKGDRALGVLEKELRHKGYNVIAPVVYHAEFRKNLSSDIESTLRLGPIDCFAFTSPYSVESLASTLKNMGNSNFIENTVISAIGPSTQKSCLDAGWPVTILPEEFTVQSMARSILRFFQRHPKIQ